MESFKLFFGWLSDSWNKYWDDDDSFMSLERNSLYCVRDKYFLPNVTVALKRNGEFKWVVYPPDLS